MHMCHIVFLPAKTGDIKEAVERAMAPFGYDENKPDEGPMKWDWWRIGGRYDGVIKSLDSNSTDGGFNFDPRHEGLDRNVCLAKDIKLPWEGGPYSWTDHKGQWHEKPEQHDFKMVNGQYEAVKRPTYEKEYQDFGNNFDAYVKKNPNLIAVMVDYHN